MTISFTDGEIARFVKPCVLPRDLHVSEGRSRQVRLTEISQGQSITSNVQLTYLSRHAKLIIGIQNMKLGVCNGRSNRNGLSKLELLHR